MGNDLISIIIPAYNAQSYIEKCLHSLLRQTYTNFEVIVVDDGSTDGTKQCCSGISEKIKYVYQDNSGQGAARNKGIQVAKGEYITFVDADDWCDERYLELMYKSMLTYDTDICVCGKYSVKLNEAGEIISRVAIPQWSASNEKLYVKDNKDLISQIKFSLWAKMFKKSLFLENDIWQPNHKFENNTVIPMLVMNAKTISIVKECLYYYWINRSSSTVNSLRSYFDMSKCLNTVIDYAKTHGFQDDFASAIYNYLKWNVNHTINQTSKFKKEFPDDVKRIRTELCKILSLYDEKHVSWPDKKVAVWGSNALKSTVCELVPRENIVCEYAYSTLESVTTQTTVIERQSHPNPYREKMLARDIAKTFMDEDLSKADYIFVDLLEERFPTIPINQGACTASDILREVVADLKQPTESFDVVDEQWKASCDKFAKHLLSFKQAKDIVLVKYKLSEAYGDYESRKSYDDLDTIQKINASIDEKYDYFAEQCKGCVVIDVALDRYYYSDALYEYGCHPQYVNNMVYFQVAKQIDGVLNA